MNDKRISFAVYALLWLVLIFLQTLTTSLQGLAEESVFQSPRLYYSTWITDLYLIGLFYLNYYVLAPRLMRRRLFRAYLWIIAIAAGIGLLIPLLCYGLWGLSMPSFAEGVAPVSSLGVAGAVAAIALGLCARALLEWDKLNQEVTTLREEHAHLSQERDSLHARLEGIQHTQLQAASSALGSSVTAEEDTHSPT